MPAPKPSPPPAAGGAAGRAAVVKLFADHEDRAVVGRSDGQADDAARQAVGVDLDGDGGGFLGGRGFIGGLGGVGFFVGRFLSSSLAIATSSLLGAKRARACLSQATR